jgi:hypothetical protein
LNLLRILVNALKISWRSANAICLHSSSDPANKNRKTAREANDVKGESRAQASERALD